MRECKAYMNPSLSRAMELVFTREIIVKERKTALPIFDAEVLSEETRDGEIGRYCQELDKMFKASYFVHILSPEVNKLARRARTEMPSEEHWDEVKKLLQVLDGLIDKSPDVDIHLTVHTKNIKISIVLVGRTGKFLNQGPRAHSYCSTRV